MSYTTGRMTWEDLAEMPDSTFDKSLQIPHECDDDPIIAEDLEDVNIHNYKISDKQIDVLASKISGSIRDCQYCQIKKFCKEATDCGTCEVTWAEWLFKTIVL